MPKPPETARGGAVQLLNAVLIERRLMAEIIASGALQSLQPGDRARAQRLAVETLRGLERVDRLLSRHLRKTPPDPVRNILRLAAYELCSGGDPHGVVNAAVNLVAATKRGGHLKGLANAVLRKVAADGSAAYGELRVPHLPKWLRKPLQAAYGSPTVAAIEQAHFQTPPVDITVKNPDKLDHWAETLGAKVVLGGSLRLTSAGQISALPGYESGAWWVQDAAAALPVRLLGDIEGASALDLCAAPGGKTMQLAAAGAVTRAIDISPTRLSRVEENLRRTQLEAQLEAQDALEHGGESYDIVLLDAPCSATGTIRRHPDLPYAKDGSDFFELIELQGRMIDHAISLLNPGGRLVFCTCSLLPDEGECQIEEALKRHRGLKIDHSALETDIVDSQMKAAPEGLRLRPDMLSDKGGLDGFFISILRWDGQ
jgi:16S rRNA (cytosine967-C5)-methyltransferase